MTILEAIQSSPGLENIEANAVSKVLIDRAIDGAVDYTLAFRKDVDLSVADLYVRIANSPDFSEGTLSITYDRKTLLKMADDLYALYDESKGKIKALNLW